MENDEIIRRNVHISTREILQDISDTENEILIRRRLNYDSAGIAERQMFLDKLRNLLALREQAERGKGE